MSQEFFVHPQGLCESTTVGPGTRIWAFAHVLKGAQVGANCNIGEGAFIESGAVLGDSVTVKNGVYVWDGVRVEDEVFLGPACVLTNRRRPRSQQGRPGPRPPFDQTLIRRGATIGAGAVLVAPVVINKFAMVGAGSVLSRDVPAHALVVGNPARQIGWVCVCGASLDGQLACSQCGSTFRQGSGGLE